MASHMPEMFGWNEISHFNVYKDVRKKESA